MEPLVGPLSVCAFQTTREKFHVFCTKNAVNFEQKCQKSGLGGGGVPQVLAYGPLEYTVFLLEILTILKSVAILFLEILGIFQVLL